MSDSLQINELLRYGISALSMEHKNVAQNDELLVNSSDGKMFYKRETDGQIVSFESNFFQKQELISEMKRATSSVALPVVDDDYVVYHTIDITGKNNMLSTDTFSLEIDDKKFPVSGKESGFYIRVRGNNVTNAFVSFIDTLNADKSKKFVTLNFKVTELADDTTSDLSVEVDFNNLTFIPLTAVNVGSNFTVALESISYPVANVVYSQLSSDKKSALISLNNGNEKVEASEIDIVTYTDDISSSLIYDVGSNVKLQYMVTTAEVNSSFVDSQSFIISEEKPVHRCIWGKILKK